MKPWRILASATLFTAGCSQPRDGNAQSTDTVLATAPSAATSGASVDVLPKADTEAAAIPMPATSDSTHATVIGSLKTELVGKGTMDRAPITDVRLTARCVTTFVSGKVLVSINWSKVGNFAGEIHGDKATIPIDDGSGVHRFTIPNGVTFRRVDGSMGLLADDCGGPM